MTGGQKEDNAARGGLIIMGGFKDSGRGVCEGIPHGRLFLFVVRTRIQQQSAPAEWCEDLRFSEVAAMEWWLYNAFCMLQCLRIVFFHVCCFFPMSFV